MSRRQTSYCILTLHALHANSWGTVTQWINRQNTNLSRNAELNNVIPIFDYGGLCTHCQKSLSTTTMAQVVGPDQTPRLLTRYQRLMLWQYWKHQAPCAIFAFPHRGVIFCIVMSSRHNSYGILIPMHLTLTRGARSPNQETGRIQFYRTMLNETMWFRFSIMADYVHIAKYLWVRLTMAQVVRPDQIPSILLSISTNDTLTVLNKASTQRHIGFLTPWSHITYCHVEPSH
jgi:hypothetical protein